MTTLPTAPFKQQLLGLRASLTEQLAALRGGNISRAEASGNHFAQSQDSRAQLNTERELEFALDEHDSAELQEIAAALARIEAGTYGYCADCGEQIPAARLHAAPQAGRCIDCQEKVEAAAG